MKTMQYTIPVVHGDCKNDSEVENAGLRDFYDEVSELVVRELDDLLDELKAEPLDVYVPNSDMQEVCQWLANAKVYAAFKPVTYTNERGLTLLRLTK